MKGLRVNAFVILGLGISSTLFAGAGTAFDTYRSNDPVSKVLRRLHLSGAEIHAFKRRNPEVLEIVRNQHYSESKRPNHARYGFRQQTGPRSELAADTRSSFHLPSVPTVYQSLDAVLEDRHRKGTLTPRKRFEAKVIRERWHQMEAGLVLAGESKDSVRAALHASLSDPAFKAYVRDQMRRRYMAYERVEDRVIRERWSKLEAEWEGEPQDLIERRLEATLDDNVFVSSVIGEVDGRKTELAFEERYELLKRQGKLTADLEYKAARIRGQLIHLRAELQAQERTPSEIETALHGLRQGHRKPIQ